MNRKATISAMPGYRTTRLGEDVCPRLICGTATRAVRSRLFAGRALPLVLALALITGVPNQEAFAGRLSPAQRCQKAIDHVARRYVRRRLKQLFECATKKIRQDKNVTACLDTGPHIAVSVSKKDRNRLAKACPTDVITGPPSENAVGFRACITPARCLTPTDPSSLADCIECSHAFATECLFRVVYNAVTEACESL